MPWTMNVVSSEIRIDIGGSALRGGLEARRRSCLFLGRVVLEPRDQSVPHGAHGRIPAPGRRAAALAARDHREYRDYEIARLDDLRVPDLPAFPGGPPVLHDPLGHTGMA